MGGGGGKKVIDEKGEGRERRHIATLLREFFLRPEDQAGLN